MKKKDLYKITWVEGEDYCRFDDELSTPEWWKSKCGIDGEIYKAKGIISTDGHLYIEPNINVYRLLSFVGTLEKKIEYDYALNMGRGHISVATREDILGKADAFVLRDADNWKKVKIKPYSQFVIDFPKYNEVEYKKLMKSLDYYYKYELHKEPI